MQPAMIILSAWLLFGGSHLLFSGSPLRARLVNRIGARGFTLVFTIITAITMIGLIVAVARYGDKGIPGFGLNKSILAQRGLGVISIIGTILAVAGLINYPRSPMAVLAQLRRKKHGQGDVILAPPSIIERITRHPFFAGLAIMMSAHMLLADTLASATYFAGFVSLAIAGMSLQDKKLRRQWKQTYIDFESKTSNFPFKAWRASGDADQPVKWRRWLVVVLITSALFGGLHKLWAYANGAPFAAFMLLFGLLGVLLGLRSKKKASGD